MRRLRLLLPLVGLLAALPATAAAQGRVEPIPGLGAEADAIVAGADGAMWASLPADPGRIARITTAGAVTYVGVGGLGGFPADRAPSGVTSTSGAVWFRLSGGADTFARLRPGHAVEPFSLAAGVPTSLVGGPDGALWMTVDGGPGQAAAIARFTADPPDELSFPLPGRAGPRAIVAAPDGALWFARGNQLGRITTAGALTLRTIAGGSPEALAADVSGALWYAQGSTVRRLDDPTAYWTGSPVAALAAGPDGALWAAVQGGAARIVPGETPTFVDVDPAARSRAIAAGPDGRMWLTLDRPPYLVKIAVAEEPEPTATPIATASPAPAPLPDTPAVPARALGPVEGKSVEVAVVSGSVSYRAPASKTYLALKGKAVLPLGVLLDTTTGKVRVAAQVDGTTQQGTFHGGKFSVTQTSTGMTELALAGPLDCSAREKATTASLAKKKKKKRSIWGKDSGGSFRTRGNSSVATVRGTEWRTEDTCAGTTIYVRDGAVSVWPRRGGRSTLVRAGQRLFSPRPG
jgi:streptogramin lyase